MEGVIKKIDGKFPVTTTKAVYIDGTSKTLQDALDNKELGGSSEVSVNGRPFSIAIVLRGKIKLTKDIGNLSNSTKWNYSVDNSISSQLNRLFVYTGGGSSKWVELTNGSIEHYQGLVYNVTSNTLTTKTGTWAGISCSADELLLMYNHSGCLSGLLSPYFDYGTDDGGYKIKEIVAEKVSSIGSSQGIIVIDNVVYSSSLAADDHSTYGKLGNKNQNICHMNAPEYNAEKDMLIVGNGSKVFSGLEMKGWIFPNFKSVFNNSASLEFNVLDKIELSFTDTIFDGEYKAQLCFGYGDNAYLATSDNRVIRKLKLCKGSVQGSYGTFVSRTDGGYNGTYNILGTWRSHKTDTIGGMAFYKGSIYFGVKGKYGIRKCIMKSDGYFDSEYIVIDGFVGDMQGIAIYQDKVYAYSDTEGYKFDLSEL